jgi:hypothetical protein
MTALMEKPMAASPCPKCNAIGACDHRHRFLCGGCGRVFLFAAELTTHVFGHRDHCDGSDCQHGKDGAP